MTMSARITRLETHLRAGGAALAERKRQFWAEHLDLLTDAQLDRLEALALKMGLDREDNQERDDITDLVHALNADDRAELEQLYSAMGLGEVFA